ARVPTFRYRTPGNPAEHQTEHKAQQQQARAAAFQQNLRTYLSKKHASTLRTRLQGARTAEKRTQQLSFKHSDQNLPSPWRQVRPYTYQSRIINA
ncbi:MAG: hypothetical protein ACTHLD_16690, partial [Chitinophaga sp.]